MLRDADLLGDTPASLQEHRMRASWHAKVRERVLTPHYCHHKAASYHWTISDTDSPDWIRTSVPALRTQEDWPVYPTGLRNPNGSGAVRCQRIHQR